MMAICMYILYEHNFAFSFVKFLNIQLKFAINLDTKSTYIQFMVQGRSSFNHHVTD